MAGSGRPSSVTAQGAPATAARTGPPSAVNAPPSRVNSIAAAPGPLPTRALEAASASRSIAPELDTPKRCDPMRPASCTVVMGPQASTTSAVLQPLAVIMPPRRGDRPQQPLDQARPGEEPGSAQRSRDRGAPE